MQTSSKQLSPSDTTPWSSCTHVWGLFERKRAYLFGQKAGEGKMADYVLETWYCTHCRLVEQRRVEGAL